MADDSDSLRTPGPTDDVAARYAGPARRVPRRLWAALGAAVVVAAVATLSLAVTDREVTWREVGFEAVSPELTTVTFEVFAPAGSQVRCQVRATDESFIDVGQVDVDLGPVPRQGLRHTVRIRTLAEAASGSVRVCVPREERPGAAVS